MRTSHRYQLTMLATAIGVLVVAPAAAAPAFAQAAAAPSGVVINEIVSTGGDPGDWVELMNTGTAPVDVSGWSILDDNDTHTAVPLPTGSTIDVGGFLVVDESTLGFGLGSQDSATLFDAEHRVVDSYAWSAHAGTSYGRCPNGTGGFTTTGAATKDAPNACAETVAAAPWPGGSDVRTADVANTFGENLSGLYYQASGTAKPGVLWAVRNGPSTLYRLLWDGSQWVPDTANGWEHGKALTYTDGSGDPDAEGVTAITDGSDASDAASVYVSTERNNDNDSVSRPAVLRFDTTESGATLTATDDWNLTADIPGLPANKGAEAVTWIPDSFLSEHGFVDENTGAPYVPGDYPGHGDGLFFVGIEADGSIHAYAFEAGGQYQRISSTPSGFPGVMDLQFDQERQSLWAVCDDTCDGRSATLTIATSGSLAGHFAVQSVFERPAGMPNINNEGFTTAPQAECVNGLKPVFWSDDGETDGHALRAGTIQCTPADDGQPEPATLVLSANSVAAGGSLQVVASGFTPKESVAITLHSAPVTVATVTASADGTVSATVGIPADTAVGAHTLTATGATSGAIASADLIVTAIVTAPGGSTPPGQGPSTQAPSNQTAASHDAAGALASTGSSVDGLVTAALLLSLAGLAAWLVSTRRMSRAR
ncbi:MAG TPA: lamin tail domain-containing protein [Microbacteriaceae bacterium]|nr:lamin tail domain-containing protein [Microbacteriaceae bacterium]